MQPPTVKRTRSLCTPSSSRSARGRRTSSTSSSTVYSARSRSAADAPSASITVTMSACAMGNADFITGLHCSSPWSSTCSRRLTSISPSRTLTDASLLSPSTYWSSLTCGGAVASEANRRSAAPNCSANMRHSQRGMIASVTRPSNARRQTVLRATRSVRSRAAPALEEQASGQKPTRSCRQDRRSVGESQSARISPSSSRALPQRFHEISKERTRRTLCLRNPAPKRTRDNGRCLARTGDLLLVRQALYQLS